MKDFFGKFITVMEPRMHHDTSDQTKNKFVHKHSHKMSLSPSNN